MQFPSITSTISYDEATFYGNLVKLLDKLIICNIDVALSTHDIKTVESIFQNHFGSAFRNIIFVTNDPTTLIDIPASMIKHIEFKKVFKPSI
jgi:hypothetical protein